MLEKMKFHHIGIAVRDFGKSLTLYSQLGYSASEVVYDPLQQVELIFLTHEIQPAIELVKPFDEYSPIQNYLKENDNAIYHICYEVNTFDAVILEFKKKHRVFTVAKAQPAVLFGGREVAFYYIHQVGLIELLKSKNEI